MARALALTDDDCLRRDLIKTQLIITDWRISRLNGNTASFPPCFAQTCGC